MRLRPVNRFTQNQNCFCYLVSNWAEVVLCIVIIDRKHGEAVQSISSLVHQASPHRQMDEYKCSFRLLFWPVCCGAVSCRCNYFRLFVMYCGKKQKRCSLSPLSLPHSSTSQVPVSWLCFVVFGKKNGDGRARLWRHGKESRIKWKKKKDGKEKQINTHGHQRRSSDAASLAPALCSAMSGELTGGREGGREEKPRGGGMKHWRKEEAELYSSSMKEAAVILPGVLGFYLSVVWKPISQALQLQKQLHCSLVCGCEMRAFVRARHVHIHRNFPTTRSL